ncbi:hypothetical protein K439DRAFT_1648775 [Ramaria rubella]|nr:hypothetical protein K439DRAFT_1648775 [Ramaria rubella]
MNHHVSIKHIHFYADNNSAIQNIFEAKTKAGQEQSARFRETVIAFLDADPTHTVEVTWSPGHEGTQGNKRADVLAKAATQLRGPEWTLVTHALRIAKAASIDSWRREWACVPPSGRFAPADQSPPANKPPPHFFNLERHTYGLTRAHILQDCPRYNTHRHILDAVVPNGRIADILGMKEGIAALADFIEASGTFTKTGESPIPAKPDEGPGEEVQD